MGRPAKKLLVQESIADLKKLHKQSAPHLKVRLQLLLLIKTDKAHTKQALALALGIDPNSAQHWKKRYEQGGLELLLCDKRGGYKKPVIDPDTDKAIVARLSDPCNAPRSFTELWA